MGSAFKPDSPVAAPTPDPEADTVDIAKKKKKEESTGYSSTLLTKKNTDVPNQKKSLLG